MNVTQKIKNALKSIMTEGEVNACTIEKSHHYNGVTEQNGWHYTPFGECPITLGKNVTEALETIEQIREEREYYQ